MRNTLNCAVALLLPLLAMPLAAQSFAGAPDAARLGFGRAVAVGDGEVFVGEGANVLRPGIVYVYRADGDGQWTERDQLTAAGSERGDGFGSAIAVFDDMLLVGQVPEDGASRVHIFQRAETRWRHTGRLEPEDGVVEGSEFGSSLALQGPLAAVGAPGSDEVAGRVYLYRWNPRIGWEPAEVLTASDGAAGDGFGASIAIDGYRMLIGAPSQGDGAGAAYVFKQDPGTGEWTEEARLSGGELERRSAFGEGVALEGDRALVSAPGALGRIGAVMEYQRDPATSEWLQTHLLMPFDANGRSSFGSALGLQQGVAYIGAPGAGDAGAIYLYRSGDEGWAAAEKLVGSDVEEGGSFGSTLAVRGDIAVTGAVDEDFGAGSAVILSRRSGEWRVAAKLESEPAALEAVTGDVVRCDGGEAALFDCDDVDLLSFLPVRDLGGDRGVRLNDIWGWTDPQTGREYALVGRVDGTSFVDVTDPTNPRYLGDLPKTEGSNAAVWRDIKVYEDHAFIVADGAGQHGMQVFDLTRLRNVQRPVTFDADAIYDRIASSHNIVMDTASGFAFAVGARGGGTTCGGGLHMIDVRNPTNPEFAGCFADPQTGRASTGYSHDAQCITYEGPDADYSGRQICLGANETALSIADVTDKENPVAVARASYPNVGYTHQGWLTPDQRYFYMNDELDELQGKVSRTRTLIWDVTDLDDPQLVGEFMGTTAASDHNLYIRGNTMYQSNYQAGLRVIDISDPENPREIGYFDTVPYGENEPGFGGSWSNYPFFPSGTIVVTSGREGLFVLRKREPVS